jgi:site-specific recombinase XerD
MASSDIRRDEYHRIEQAGEGPLGGNPHTRRAYARACGSFFGWCEQRGLTLTAIRPHHVATYIEQLQNEASAPSVKQQLVAVRMIFDWLVIGRIVPANPASAVRGPKHLVKTGTTPVLEAEEWRNCSTTFRW